MGHRTPEIAAGLGTACAPTQRLLQRARGDVFVASKLLGRCSTLAELRQEGSAKAFFPQTGGARLDAVLVNTAGGITDGDRFSYAADAGPGSRLGLTTQAAERAYRARQSEAGRVDVRLSAGADARIDWLPQETILYDGSSLSRQFQIDLGKTARLLAVEPVIFGRAAFGETLTRIDMNDQWRIRIEGRLVFADALRLNGASAETLARSALLAGAGAMASVVYVGADAELHLAGARRLLPRDAGASLVRPGVLVARLLARDGLDLRRDLVPVLEHLRQAPLPRMWSL